MLELGLGIRFKTKVFDLSLGLEAQGACPWP